MSKPRKRKPQRRPQSHSRLADHKRQGKMLTPPLLAVVGDKLRSASWDRDQFPDFLWSCWHLDSGEPRDLVKLVKYLDRIGEIIGPDREGFPEHWLLTGRLTVFEAIPEGIRARLLDELLQQNLYEAIVPEEFAQALGMYPSAPGRWLIRPRLEAGMRIDPESAQRGLERVTAAAMGGQSPVATRAKAAVFRQYVHTRRLSMPPALVDEWRDIIVRYPMETTPEETSKVETFIRATFGAMEGAMEEKGDGDSSGSTWSQTFWRSNWSLFPCRRREARREMPLLSEGDKAAIESAYHEMADDIKVLRERFEQLADATNPDLFNPDRYEVLTGVVARVLRYLNVYIGYPALWTMEHGAPLLRSVVEARIIIRYLSAADTQSDIFRRFKAYGMGRLKLLKLHFEEYLAAEDDPHEDMIAYVDYLESLVNQDILEEFQDINLGGNFAGKDMRKMAAEVGLEREYRLIFAPASSNVHGEWSVIDEYALERCRNPLHRGHRIIRRNTDAPVGAMVVDTIAEFASLLVDEYEQATSQQRSLAAKSPEST
ncbi:DUF5677 domain-containing protein [Streptomyces sp. NPDC086777]|uniref:DUF5677 domain-containing protein n=1 Tax=Streptomyces sp. NPDC086777 TaxID=3154866 RepID=UPI0034508D8F